MFRWFYDLDRILRGDATQPDQIVGGEVRVPLVGIFASVMILGAVSGLCTGSFAFFRGIEKEVLNETWKQTIASTMKVPALYLLTLIVTFPSLYVFSTLVGSRLSIKSVLKLLLAGLGVNMAVLASLGPIVAFFSASTPSYLFIVLLNIIVYALSGFLGLVFLAQTLTRLIQTTAGDVISSAVAKSDVRQLPNGDALSGTADVPVEIVPAAPSIMSSKGFSEPTSMHQNSARPGPLDRVRGTSGGNRAITVFACWIVVFGLVGAQMSWILRPFIGSPGMPFTLFRPRESNFFEAAWRTLLNVFS